MEKTEASPVRPREEILPNAIYLTDDAAFLTGTSASTICKMVRTGKIRGRGKPFRILGSELLKLAGISP